MWRDDQEAHVCLVELTVENSEKIKMKRSLTFVVAGPPIDGAVHMVLGVQNGTILI